MMRQKSCLQPRELEEGMAESGLPIFVFFVVLECDCRKERAGVNIDERSVEAIISWMKPMKDR